jgi:hypothetical protein
MQWGDNIGAGERLCRNSGGIVETRHPPRAPNLRPDDWAGQIMIEFVCPPDVCE